MGALTPEQWKRYDWMDSVRVAAANDRTPTIPYQPGQEEGLRLHLAATAMRGQPFGFTWEDADGLRTIAYALDTDPDAPTMDPDDIRDLSDRIAALLPPRS